MKKDDYGYFGKGTEGYIHYKKTFDRLQAEQPPKAKHPQPAGQQMSQAEWNRKLEKVMLTIAVIATTIAVPIMILSILMGNEETVGEFIKLGVLWLILGVLYGVPYILHR